MRDTFKHNLKSAYAIQRSTICGWILGIGFLFLLCMVLFIHITSVATDWFYHLDLNLQIVLKLFFLIYCGGYILAAPYLINNAIYEKRQEQTNKINVKTIAYPPSWVFSWSMFVGLIIGVCFYIFYRQITLETKCFYLLSTPLHVFLNLLALAFSIGYLVFVPYQMVCHKKAKQLERITKKEEETEERMGLETKIAESGTKVAMTERKDRTK